MICSHCDRQAVASITVLTTDGGLSTGPLCGPCLEDEVVDIVAGVER